MTTTDREEQTGGAFILNTNDQAVWVGDGDLAFHRCPMWDDYAV